MNKIIKGFVRCCVLAYQLVFALAVIAFFVPAIVGGFAFLVITSLIILPLVICIQKYRTALDWKFRNELYASYVNSSFVVAVVVGLAIQVFSVFYFTENFGKMIGWASVFIG